MKRKFTILILLCFMLSGCTNKSVIATSSETETDTTQVIETENNEQILDHTFEVDKVFTGISYKLGEDNTTSEKSTLKMKGTGKKNSTGAYSFQGILKIDGKEYHLSYEQDGSNILSYSSSEGYTRTYGDVYFDADFSSVSIRILDIGWSNEDGNMLTYPCATKPEALEIANKLMKEQLASMGISSLK